MTVAYGPTLKPRNLAYDHLVIATGSEDNFFGKDELATHALTMKTLTDAMLLRKRTIALLENAVLEGRRGAAQRHAHLRRRRGGSHRRAQRFRPRCAALVSHVARRGSPPVLVHPQDIILPELGEALGRYAHQKPGQRKVEILTRTRVDGYAGRTVRLDQGEPIPAKTLIWTAGVTPGKLIADLSCEKERGRLKVDEFLALPGHAGVWALGDCASALDASTGRPFPTTAQHAIRQGTTVARNIAASLRQEPLRPFRFKMLGQLAAIGQHAGVAQIFGLRFSGLLAWLMWRAIYLAKLPRL